MFNRRSSSTVRLLVAVVTVVATAVVIAPSATAPAGAATIPPKYTGPAVTGPENVTFLYHSLDETAAAGQLDSIGHPRDLVYGSTNTATVPGTADEPAYAHSIGARAFKYMQISMFPLIYPTWSGITKEQRAQWTLCKTGNAALQDHEDGDGTAHGSVPWAYADTNEQGYVGRDPRLDRAAEGHWATTACSSMSEDARSAGRTGTSRRHARTTR